MNLTTKVTTLNRVGKVLEKKLKHLGIETVQDLLFYLPFRYEDYSKLVPIKDLQDGEQVTIKGKIELISNKRSPRKRKIITEAVVADETERLRVIWFGQPFIAKVLRVGDTVYLSGKVTSDMLGTQMVSPSYESVRPFGKLRAQGKFETTHTARIVPMYSLTSGITQKQLRFLMSQVIHLHKKVPEWIPEEILEEADFVPLSEAIRGIHFPKDEVDLKQSTRRLKFGELFLLQLRAEMIRQSLKSSKAPKLKFKQKQIKEFVDSLPFALTKDQKVASWEILQDLEKGEPMNRLLEGDVGSGKTVVAAMALYSAVLNGKQAVIMAPTEVLAFQHFDSLVDLFKNFNVNLSLLTRSKAQASKKLKVKSKKSLKKQKEDLVEQIKSGEVKIIVGTHALLTESVEFKNLGLVIVDEQHRFGVEQRKVIKEKPSYAKASEGKFGNKKTTPHFLSMTATPIPRSFALTLYGDLDLSIIKEMPPGRKPVTTRLIDPHNREKAYDFIKDQVKEGRQVFVICPLIQKSDVGSQKSDTLDKKSVMEEYEKLSEKIFPNLKIGYLHGKLKIAEKEDTMKKFKDGKLDLLVSTSVVEVGVDVPNASVMMIEGAERFGLAQLHQFRGRVGRSERQSYCFLFTDSDAKKALERLEFFQNNADGFKVAEYDLEMRGPGEVYGRAQSGMMSFRLATMKDVDLIKLARKMAKNTDFFKYPILRGKVKEWEERVHLE